MTLSPSSGTYDNGEVIEYSLTLTNTSGATLADINVNDAVLNIVTSGESGNTVNAFTRADISASASFLSSAGDYNKSGNLAATNVSIRNNGVVTYTIRALVANEANGSIENTASVRHGALSVKNSNSTLHERVIYEHDISLTASLVRYGVGQELTYTLKVVNTGTSDIKGMTVENLVADITAESINGGQIPAFNAVSNTASVSGSGTNAGVYASSGNLEATGVSISVGGAVTYTIRGTVSTDLVGDIINDSAVAQTRDALEAAATITTPPNEAQVSLTHTLDKSADYLVGDVFSYSISVKNAAGAGVAYNYTVQQLIDEVAAKLANDVRNETNADDISGHPYITWVNEVTRIGANSFSELASSGSELNQALNDNVSIYPGEEILYSILVTVSPVSIGQIPAVVARVIDDDDVIEEASSALNTAQVLTSTSNRISRVKSTTDTSYISGSANDNEVIYHIEVANSDPLYFANNIFVRDRFDCVVTQQADGSVAQAFSEWKLETMSREGEGSNFGSYNYGAWTTSDINLKIDLAPQGNVRYKLTARVADTSVGQIVDDGTDAGRCLGDNLGEIGSGVQIPNPKLEVQKEVDSRFYSAGSPLNYTITIKNSGGGYALDVPVYDDLASVTTTSINGTSTRAYVSWLISAQSFTSDGTPSTASDPGFTGGINGDQTNKNILDVSADLAPFESIVYSIEAIVTPIADGEIRNRVSVDNTLYSDRGSYPRDYYLLFDKRVDGNDEQSWYTDTTATVTYTITVTNPEENGFASNVRIKDEISTIEAELLEPVDGKTAKPVFSSWTISADKRAASPWVLAVTDAGVFADNQDLDVIAQLPPGATITYTIVGTLDRSDDTEILWGRFTNTAMLLVEDLSLTDTVITSPNEPNLVVAKTAQNRNFVVGETATFDIYIYNRGVGYANDARVQDDIASLNFFSQWRITPSTNTDKPGSRYGEVSNNTNIDTDVDITPGGWVHYEVTGIVRSDYPFEQVSNVVEVYDPITDREHDASAQIDNSDSIFNINVSLTKTTNVVRYTPGQDLIYTIVMANNDDVEHTDLVFIDRLSDITTTLANDKDGEVEDFLDQNPFEYWSVDTGNGFGTPTTEDIEIPITLPANDFVTVKIKARVKDNAVSNGIDGGQSYQIRNEAFLLDINDVGCTSDCRFLKRSVAENAQVFNGGDVIRQTNLDRYSPGDELVYTIEYNSQSGRGYRNNVSVDELINSISVELQDGTAGHPFYDDVSGTNKFAVSVVKSNVSNAGTTDGTRDGNVKDNTDIITTIDIDENESVTYTVEGIIRPDAVGNIIYRDTFVIPNDYRLDIEKVTDEAVYEPNQTITYRLIIENDGAGNAHDIPVIDELSSITTALVDGTTGPAFSTWTITSNATGDDANYVDAGAGAGNIYSVKDRDLRVFADIPMGARLEYQVIATVNEKANGAIVNTLSVDGDSIANQIGQDTQQIDYEKNILAYYDTEGNKLTGATHYMPGGFVEYEILIENTSMAHIDNMSIRDDIAGITTDYYDGTRGPAFDSWTISTDSDGSTITDPDVDNTLQDNQSIDTRLDIAAKGFGGVLIAPFVRYVILAKISPKAVGRFSNQAYLDEDNGNRFVAASPPSSMAEPKINFNKRAYYDASFTRDKTTYSQEVNESEVYYLVRLKNSGFGTEYGGRLKDTISNIQTRIAEDSATAGGDPVGNPFIAGWQVSLEKDASDGSITDAVGFVDGNNIDIDNDIVIAPQETLTFTIYGKIREDALGDIQNTATYDGQNRTAILLPLSNHIDVEKRVVSINGTPFSQGDTYIPGDEVEYEFSVTNTENGWANDIRIQDTVTNIDVEVIGGATKPAYEAGNISHQVSNGIDADVDTYVPRYSATANLNIEVDIAAGEVVTFRLVGQVRDDAVGMIAANQVTADGQSAFSEVIPPTVAELNFFKTLVYTDAEDSCALPSADGSGCKYAPRGDVEYQVTLENIGESIANDVRVIDAINTIVTSDGLAAFSEWSVGIAVEPEGSYDVQGNYNGNVPLNATVDLRAGDRIVFDVRGTVTEAATGTITNTAQVNGVNTNDIVLDAGRAIILMDKWTDTPEYEPGGDVHYFIDVTNNDVDNAQLTLRDIISNFEVETVDGTMQTALTEWFVTYDVLANSAPNDPAANDFSELDKLLGLNSPDIDLPLGSIKIAGRDDTGLSGGDKYTIVRVHIQGKVRDDAVGRFTNTATAIYGLGSKVARLEQGYITPKPGQLVLSKETTPTPEPDAKYQPGQPISYKITLKNVGKGYLVDQRLEDRLDSILTDVANSTDQELALGSRWLISDESLGGSGDPALNKRENEVNTAQGYSASYSIHPGDSYSFVLTNTVNERATGLVTNTVTVDSDGEEYFAQAIYRPEEAQLQITKSVDRSEYVPSEILQYTVTVTNSGLGWAEDVLIEDALTSIESTLAGGLTGEAFESTSIRVSAVSKTGETIVPPPSTGEDLKQVLDIAPEDSVVFTIQATTSATVVGNITNSAFVTYQGGTIGDSVISTPLSANITIEKSVDSPTYEVTKLVNYDIVVENPSLAFASRVTLEDIISAISVDTTTGNTAPAFLQWEISYVPSDERTVIEPNTFELMDDIDVVMDIAPESTVTFRIRAAVRTNAIGQITNMAVVRYNGDSQKSTAIIVPEGTEFITSKSSVQEEYVPGELLEFLIVVENISNNFINELVVEDQMTAIETTYVDGTSGPAFMPETTSLEVDSTTIGSSTERISPTEYHVDIAPKGKVVFRAKGIVVDTATGVIVNTAFVGESEVISPPVQSVSAVVQAELYTDAPHYVPGEQVVYHLVIENIGRGIAKNVAVYTQFGESMGDYIDGSRNNVFDNWTLTAEWTGVETHPGNYEDSKDLFTIVDIAPGGKIDYTFTLTVNEDMLTNIDVLGYYLDLTWTPVAAASARSAMPAVSSIQGVADKVEALDLPPIGAELAVEKRSDKPEYTEEDDVVIYYLGAVNEGRGNAANVRLNDVLSDLKSETGNHVFTDWTIEGVEVDGNGGVIQRFSFPPSEDLDVTVNLKSKKRNAFAFEVVGTLGKGLDDDITNTFIATETDGTQTSDSVTTYIKKTPDNDGELFLIKSALQDTAQVGDAVEYEVIVENNNESFFRNVTVEDRYPGGFKYMGNTSEVVLSGPDGEFDNEDDRVLTIEPSDTGKLLFTSLNFDPGEKLRIRYLLRVSIGVTFGDYINTAVSKVDGLAVSNEDSAKVTVEPDKVFDTSSIIGKVFEDHNKDGFQADATAFDVELTAYLSNQDYIAGSTIVVRDGKELLVKDEQDNGQAISAVQEGVELGDLWGHSINRTISETKSVAIQFKTRTRESFDFTVTSDGGS
ncbi:hypothetical protein ACNO5M_24270, partial [Vibrio owensii]|uniref:hypothetical protein n=1 Tax=Vibrio owensii TaxID=696485 RepID=UPI003AAE0D8C